MAGFPFSVLNRSIGIYTGTSPLNVGPNAAIANPVLTARDVTDVPAAFVADPFMVQENGRWYLFFEALNRRTQRGEIGLAESGDGRHWQYRQIVLKERFHLSYPYVFKYHNEYYLVPESYQAKEIRLYKADPFPTRWVLVKVLLKDRAFKDTSLFQHHGRWWLFTETSPSMKNDTLRLYHADNLTGSWTEHPKSPVVAQNSHVARPGGRVLVLADKVVRLAQDDWPTYGLRVRAFEITRLTETSYAERELTPLPDLGPSGSGWNGSGMHNLDPHPLSPNQWIACVDGCEQRGVFARHDEGSAPKRGLQLSVMRWLRNLLKSPHVATANHIRY